MRYFIRFAYDGANYHGWQIQPNAASVQETLNLALSTVLHVPIATTGAGRTDTGVHAREMYAHFDVAMPIDVALCVHKLNSFLPKDIAVTSVIPVHDSAHARFDATKRTYEYLINRTKDVFLQGRSWHVPHDLDVIAMNSAAQSLLAHTDFQCFSKSNTDVNTFNCIISEAQWTVEHGNLAFTISANRFLRNMVRAIVGTLVDVGLHKIDVNGFNAIIESKNRSEAGVSVPAHGLYLTRIAYDYLHSPDGSGILLS